MTALAPAAAGSELKWWKKGDIAAFFALFTNNLTNIITFTALLTMAGLPVSMVVGRIAPAFGLAILITSSMYVWFARRLAAKEGRGDVVALPSGPSAPSIFTVTFLVILPVYSTTQDAELAVGIGLVWGFLEGLILFVGSFFGDLLRRAVPRSVLLACLAGLGLLLLAMNPMLLVAGGYGVERMTAAEPSAGGFRSAASAAVRAEEPSAPEGVSSSRRIRASSPAPAETSPPLASAAELVEASGVPESTAGGAARDEVGDPAPDELPGEGAGADAPGDTATAFEGAPTDAELLGEGE